MNKIINWLKKLPWKAALKAAMQTLLPAAIGAGAACLTGCSSLVPSTKTQSMGVYAFGIPGVAVISSTTQEAKNDGDDINEPKQVNPVTVSTPIH